VIDSPPGGNGNGRFDPSESGQLTVNLRNLGNQDAHSVSARLRSGHPLFTVTDSLATFGDIPTGEGRTNDADRFAATASSSIPAGTPVCCTLLVHSEDSDLDWTWTFTLVVGVPASPPGRYIIVHTDGARPDSLIAALEALGDTLSLYDARTTPPTLDLLAPYDGVILYSRTAFASPAVLGDVLADYVDLGKALVIGNLALTTGLCAQGRVMTGDYLALLPGTINAVTANLGWFNPHHQIMTGVGTVSDIYRSLTTLAPFADSVAKWDDGKYYIATSLNRRVVAVNQHPGALNHSRMTNRDWARVYHNALAWARGNTGVGAKPGFTLGPASLACRPNPVAGSATVTSYLSRPGTIDLSIVDAAGRTVRTLARGPRPAGFFAAQWNRTAQDGGRVPSGVYFCILDAAGSRTSAKLVVR